MAAGEFVRLNTLVLFNSILFFLFCPLGFALMPHRQMKCSVPKLLICYVIYLLHKCFSFFSTSQQAIHHRFFCCCWGKKKKVMYYIVSKNLFFDCTEEERACGERGERRISPTANPWTALSSPGMWRDWSLPLGGQFSWAACCHFLGGYSHHQFLGYSE